MNNGSWPPPLKDWVASCLKEANPLNKDKVHAELKKVIFEAYRTKSIETMNWASVELESLKQQRLREQLVRQSQPPAPPPVATAKRKKPEKDTSKGLSMPSSFGITNGKSAAEDEANEKRRKRFAREHDLADVKERGGVVEMVPRVVDRMSGLTLGGSKGKKKFVNSRLGYGVEEPEPMFDPNVIDWDKRTIVGTSTQLEKRYLRLTTEPDPSVIRPLPVLIQTLELLKQKWRKELNYPYICDQFKSVRQDLTVQRIKNYFTVQVYEIHARIALESKDLGELNQCQSALRQLYEHNIPGHPEEFLAYRILYMLYTRNKSELNLLLAQLTPEQRAPPCVQHALKVQTALATSNYHSLFQLFNDAPNMGAYMMDHFIDRERVIALSTMSKAYPTLPLSFIAKELAFETSSDAAAFLVGLDAHYWTTSPQTVDDLKTLDCKAAATALADALGAVRKAAIDIKGQL